jgi:UvrB/uvrC motif
MHWRGGTTSAKICADGAILFRHQFGQGSQNCFHAVLLPELGKMKEKKPSSDKVDKLHGKSPSRDITPVLNGWEYEPGTINVRKVSGLDGTPKLQMRLDLGLLQMEVTGRPDGDRPFGRESLLDYYEEQLNEYKLAHGNEMGFHLDGEICQALREEAVMYYHRYLSLFVLEDFPGVVRDTARNLRVLDLCGKYADDEEDRLILEQYRPYVIMMNARAKGSIELQAKQFGEAMKTIDKALEQIRKFYERFGQEEAYPRSNEVRVLKRFQREIQKKLPVDPMQRLRRRLDRAVKEERYEEAAKLRDQIESRRQGHGHVSGESPKSGKA